MMFAALLPDLQLMRHVRRRAHSAANRRALAFEPRERLLRCQSASRTAPHRTTLRLSCSAPETAMYDAKEAGRNRVAVCSQLDE